MAKERLELYEILVGRRQVGRKPLPPCRPRAVGAELPEDIATEKSPALGRCGSARASPFRLVRAAARGAAAAATVAWDGVRAAGRASWVQAGAAWLGQRYGIVLVALATVALAVGTVWVLVPAEAVRDPQPPRQAAPASDGPRDPEPALFEQIRRERSMAFEQLRVDQGLERGARGPDPSGE